MATVRIESESMPAPEVGPVWWELLSSADGVGLISLEVGPEAPDLPLLRELLRLLDEAGVAKRLIVRLKKVDPSDPEKTGELIRGVLDALRASPLPQYEWKAMVGLFGVAELGILLNISDSSLNRYANGSRATPDLIAERLHFIALVVGDLRGAYNEVGVRRWWHRTRFALDGCAPATLLLDNWTPDDPGPRAISELAHSLLFATAT